ncbi:hypothetical protein TWF281_001518 [Arthrobotrys megalospora]
MDNSNPEFAAAWRVNFAPVMPDDGAWLRVYFQKQSGALVEGFWRRNENDWSFKEVLAAGIMQDEGGVLAATMWDNLEVHLFYSDRSNNLRELCLYGAYGDRPTHGPLNNFNIHTNLSNSVSVISFHRDNAPNMRLYYRDDSEVLQEYVWGAYGHQKWEKGWTFGNTNSGRSSSEVKFINLAPWHRNSPSIRGYYEDADGYFVELRWEEGGWGAGSLRQKVPDKDPEYPEEAATFSVSATGLDREPTVNFFWIANDKVYVISKLGKDGVWGSESEVTGESERNPVRLAAAGSPMGRDDTHLFTSGEGNKFIHRHRVNWSWQKEIVDPGN